ncbi:hypothetical protein HPB49_002750 [Dermacentor silvarum]|uniref:Uncharacterized protein n=1 Tax=Dermacentor silvarum TaxID=543639 RepID=A0ACB8CD98_DERSI|nr:hypothetical protein HPB49_002750 [Dermacentor silvarum]
MSPLMTKSQITVCAQQAKTRGVGKMQPKQKASQSPSIDITCHHMSARPFLPSTNVCWMRSFSSGARGVKRRTATSLHSVVWAHSPKERHASLFSVQGAVAETVLKFNAGNEAASSAILKELKVNPGLLVTKRMAEKDHRRATASARKRVSAESMQRALKKRHLGDSKQKDYMPGAY